MHYLWDQVLFETEHIERINILTEHYTIKRLVPDSTVRTSFAIFPRVSRSTVLIGEEFALRLFTRSANKNLQTDASA